MLFYSPAFLVFSLVLLALLLVFHKHEQRKIVLLLGSYIFYMWWNPAFIALIVLSTVVDFTVGRYLEREEHSHRRKLLLFTSITSNLTILGYFKYAGFLEENLLWIVRGLGYDLHWTSTAIILPVGISFYTFQTMSYTIDLYRREIPVCRSPLDFALFVSFFPQLVAGPIVRAANFLPQLNKPITLQFDRIAIVQIMRGLAKKVFIADNLAVFADPVFASPERWPSIVIVLATICFSVQIYCDFSGYSDMAIGIARGLGFELPQNFDRPYFAKNPGDFWRRWHISLSSWLRDYLYIPLGGNQEGTLIAYRNVLITMFLGGLWHGASWNFVLWGLLHAAAIITYRMIASRQNKSEQRSSWGGELLSWFVMQYIVLVTWITFRVTDTEKMLTALRKFLLFDFDFQIANIGLGSMSLFSTLGILSCFCVLHLAGAGGRGLDNFLEKSSNVVFYLFTVLIAVVLCFGWPLAESPFIYFQF